MRFDLNFAYLINLEPLAASLDLVPLLRGWLWRRCISKIELFYRRFLCPFMTSLAKAFVFLVDSLEEVLY